MELNKDHISFNAEERHVSGLPESMPIEAANTAFGMTRRARQHCFEAFESLVLCDVESVSEQEARTIRLYPPRLRQLDELSHKLAAVIAPHMAAELEANLSGLAEADSLPYFR